MMKFNNRKDYDKAVLAIESWDKGNVKEVKKIGNGRHVEPDLTKPYTKYNDEELTIDDNDIIKDILDKGNVEFVVVNEREDLINTLTEAAESSGLVVPFESFYYKHRKLIFNWLNTGNDDELINMFKTSTEVWLDIRIDKDKPTPREFAQDLFKKREIQ